MTSNEIPAANVENELTPGTNKEVEANPISSNAAAKREKEKHEATKKDEKKKALQSFKNAIMISGIVVAVAGAIFAIAKKLREK